MDRRKSSLAQIKEFMKSKGNRVLRDIDKGKSFTKILEEYFESKECIDFDYKQNRLSLNFEIFLNQHQSFLLDNTNNRGDSVAIQMDAVSNCEADMLNSVNDYWFLECLAHEKVLKSLCKHPYVTAFLDIHYSTVEKARSQMKDSVPHLALSLLLMVFVSTMPGSLHNNYDNVLIWAILVCCIVLSLDILSLIGLNTPLFNYWLRGSLVRNRKRRPFWFPGRNTYQNCMYMFIHLTHVLGYVFCLTTLLFGQIFHKKVEHRKGSFTHNTCENNEEFTSWRMIQMSLICYPVLLLLVEITKMKFAKRSCNFLEQKKTWIDFISIALSLTIALVSRQSHVHICMYPWIPDLIWIAILLSFSQLIDDIVDSIPNNDIIQVDIYRHIFYQVARTYLVIMAGFLPFLVAFAFCFQG